MKDHEVQLIVQSVTHKVISALQAQLGGIETNFSVIRTTLERLDGIQSSQLKVIQATLDRIEHDQAPKALESEQILTIIHELISRIMEVVQPKSLPDQVDEIKALCDKLNLTIVQKD